MPHQFEHYAAKGNELLNELTDELGMPGNKKAAARILRAVLHALRDRITIEESLQLLAQLPMAIKAVYVDGWSLKKHHSYPRSVDGFLFDVIKNDGIASLEDFDLNNEDVAAVVSAVFRVLGRHVSHGELEDIADVMPKEIRMFIREALTY